MNILFIFLFKLMAVFASEDLNNITHTTGDLKLKISSELDEVVSNEVKLNITNEFHSESKGGILQRILSSVEFICKGRFEGYYSDTEFNCQIFHYCKQNGLRFTFVCPSNSIFNQKEMICDHNVSDPKMLCNDSPNYYYLNAILYAQRMDSISANKSIIHPNDKTKFTDNTNNLRKTVAAVASTRLPTVHQTITPTVVLPFNATTIAVRPFWGFNSLSPKNVLNNKTNKEWFGLTTISPMSGRNKSDLYSSQLKLYSISQNFSSDNSFNKWYPIKSKISTNESTSVKQNPTTPLNSSPEVNSNNSETITVNTSLGDIDWDDVETSTKFSKIPPKLDLKPIINEPFIADKGLNIANTASIPYPPLPLPLLKSEPLVVLRPSYIPGTLPIATLYKQTDYMFGKPRLVHNGLYINPTYGAAIINPNSMINSMPPFGLVPSPSESLNSKLFPHNPNIKKFSNFQNALTKLSLNDIFGLKFPLNAANLKRRGNDNWDDSHLNSGNVFLKPYSDISINKWNSNVGRKHSTNLLPVNHLLSKENLVNPIYFPNIILPKDISYKKNDSNNSLFKQKIFTSKTPEFSSIFEHKKSIPSVSHYSKRMDDKDVMQPSLFFAVNNELMRKKWFETYEKIKKKHTENDRHISVINKKFENNKENTPKNFPIDSITSNITKTIDPLLSKVLNGFILFKL